MIGKIAATTCAVVIAAALCLAGWFAVSGRLRPAPAHSLPRVKPQPILKLIWRCKTADQVKASPAIVDGLVYVGSNDGRIYAIDLTSGEVRWSHPTDGAVTSPPLVLGGVVYAGSADGYLYALDAATGEPKWKYLTEGEIVGGANWFNPPSGGQPWIVVGSYDYKLYCVNSADGKLVWTARTDNSINAAPAVGGGKIVFAGCDGKLRVLSPSDGEEILSVDAGGYIVGAVALDGRFAYVGRHSGEILCIDIEVGNILWRYGTGGGNIVSSPAISSGRVFFGCRDKRVYCLDREDGHKVWTFATGGDVDGGPLLTGGKVVIGSGDGRVYVLNQTDGAKLWSYQTGGAVTGAPAVAGDIIVVGSDDGFVYAFGPPGGKNQ